MKPKHVYGILTLAVTIASSSAAMPTMALPAGYTWQLVNNQVYTTGTVYTETGGYNGQTSGPYYDTSYGVMDEPSTPWYTGNDQSDQQFIQQQVTGNYGTNSPPGPSGFRFYNNGTPGVTTLNQTSGSTSGGANFPSNAKEIRTITLTNWNNLNPDNSMATATVGQIVNMPTGGTISTSRGYGGDEMFMAVNGGTSGGTSQFGVSFNIYSMMASTQYGINEGNLSSDRDYINGSVTLQVNNAGGGSYGFDGSNRIAYGLGIASDPSINQGNIVSGGPVSGTSYENGVSTGAMVAGIPANSVGDSIDQNFMIAAGAVDQTGSTFQISFESQAEMWAWKNFGDADARFSMGPGMAGNGVLNVNYEVWQVVAIPEPSSALMGAVGGLALCLRRRRLTA